MAGFPPRGLWSAVGRSERSFKARYRHEPAQLEPGPVRLNAMAYRVIRPDDDLAWITRPHEPGQPARHVAELSERLEFALTRANIWRYEPGAKGRRHREVDQEETFVVLAGTLSIHLGDPDRKSVV